MVGIVELYDYYKSHEDGFKPFQFSLTDGWLGKMDVLADNERIASFHYSSNDFGKYIYVNAVRYNVRTIMSAQIEISDEDTPQSILDMIIDTIICIYEDIEMDCKRLADRLSSYYMR